MKDNKYYLCNNIVVLTYFFHLHLKVVYLSKTGKDNIINFQTGPLLLSLLRPLIVSI